MDCRRASRPTSSATISTRSTVSTPTACAVRLCCAPPTIASPAARVASSGAPARRIAMSDPSPLIFVGGTGRSGTHIVADLIGHHPTLHAIPIECRFHSNPKGLADVVTGKHSPSEFTSKMRRYWWHRVRARRPSAGADAAGGPAARARFAACTRSPRARASMKRSRGSRRACDMKAGPRVGDPDVLAASRRLFFDLLGPLAAEAGKPGLVEMSCFTIASAEGLADDLSRGAASSTRCATAAIRARRRSPSARRTITRPTPPRASSGGRGGWRWPSTGVRGDERLARRLHVVSLDELVWGDREGSYAGPGDVPRARRRAGDADLLRRAR